MSAEPHALPSACLRVKVADDVIVRDGGWLAGGAPFHMLRLSDSAVAHFRRWCATNGGDVGLDHSGRALARRLLDYGILLSDGCDPADAPVLGAELDVVVPVHERTDQLDRCLAALSACGASVVVVDDGSSDPSAVAEVTRRHKATITRLDVNRGPAAARNAGLRATAKPFVAFVDSDVIVPSGSLERLIAHFADPLVAIATPRVLPAFPDQSGWLAGYENRYSALDMGPVGGNAGPARHVPFVISAAMVARRSAVGSGFVEELKSGEDVDLGWRLSAAGWRVIYDPDAIVRHEHRVRLMPLFGKRWTYGRSVGPLARRHPGALAPVRVSAVTLGALATAASGRPAIAAGLFAGRAAQISRYVKGDPHLAVDVIRRDIWFGSLGVARAVRRAWSPALLLAAPRSRSARRILTLAVILRLLDGDRIHVRYMPLALLDDLIAALALWVACGETQVVDPLLPRFSR